MNRPMHVDVAWLTLVLLTLGGGFMGQYAHPGFWITLLIALITWIKGQLVIVHFLELREANPVIRQVVFGFCAIIPILMVVTYIWSAQLVRLSQSILID